MKKLFYPALLAVTIIGLVSCSNRDYTCTCEYNDISAGKVKDLSTVTGTKTQARKACSEHEANLEYYARTGAVCNID